MASIKELRPEIINIIKNYRLSPVLEAVLWKKQYGITEKLYGTDIPKRYIVTRIDELGISWGRPINKCGVQGAEICIGAEPNALYEHDEGLMYWEICSDNHNLNDKINHIVKIYKAHS